MMRGGLSVILRGDGVAPASASASAALVRFFKPDTGKEPTATPADNKQTASRESVVKTPSLQKEMKTKDVFNAAKRKEAAAEGGETKEEDGSAPSATVSAQQ